MADDPRIIKILRELLAEKTAEVEKLKLSNSIAELAKTFSFDIQVKKKNICAFAHNWSQNIFKH